MGNHKSHISIFVLLCLLVAACKKENSAEGAARGDLILYFNHVVNDQILNFGDDYTTDQGEPYTVSSFKYYIHDIKLLNDKNETVSLSADYFLVDEENSGSKRITLKVPENKYKSISWLLGVDSARNVSGAQTGALDPVNGMFWTWNSGYVMAKLEGHSPVSTLSGQIFTYHVGGYKTPHITFREITLPFAQHMTVAKDTTITISIKADINTWFSRVHTISIASNPACHSPGQLANDIADNYEGMFSVREIY
jgi:hypothetical protein